MSTPSCVCFLFSFLNAEHEQRVAEIVREEFPEAFLSVSSEVIPQYREYERFSTVGLNAYVGPKVATYVARLEEELAALGVRTGLHLMTSASRRRHCRGGRSSGPSTCSCQDRLPESSAASGPGRQAGYDNVITLDVGGTSADIGLAQEGRLRMKHLLDTKVGPYQAMIPMVDVDTIGAGGGSIAYVDGAASSASDRARQAPCRVRRHTAAAGPRRRRPTPWSTSAGSCPRRSSAAACRSTATSPGRPSRTVPAAALGMSVEEASMGAVQILSHSMVQSIEENSVRKGFDPRDFALVAEGGAGPLFAAPIAIEVGTPTVVVPQYPGIAAAMGLLATDMVYEYGSTTYQRLSKLDAAALQQRFEELETQAAPQLARTGSRPTVVVQRIVEARTSARATSSASTSARARSTTPGSRSSAPTSTTSTSASTRGGSRTRTSRFRTSASAVSA